MSQASLIVIQSESWRDAARTTPYKFRTGIHLFQGLDTETTPHDRVLVWRHRPTCGMRIEGHWKPLWQPEGETQACSYCLAEPIRYDRRRAGWWWRLLIWAFAGILRVDRRLPNPPGVPRISEDLCLSQGGHVFTGSQHIAPSARCRRCDVALDEITSR